MVNFQNYQLEELQSFLGLGVFDMRGTKLLNVALIASSLYTSNIGSKGYVEISKQHGIRIISKYGTVAARTSFTDSELFFNFQRPIGTTVSSRTSMFNGDSTSEWRVGSTGSTPDIRGFISSGEVIKINGTGLTLANPLEIFIAPGHGMSINSNNFIHLHTDTSFRVRLNGNDQFWVQDNTNSTTSAPIAMTYNGVLTQVQYFDDGIGHRFLYV